MPSVVSQGPPEVRAAERPRACLKEVPRVCLALPFSLLLSFPASFILVFLAVHTPCCDCLLHPRRAVELCAYLVLIILETWSSRRRGLVRVMAPFNEARSHLSFHQVLSLQVSSNLLCPLL